MPHNIEISSTSGDSHKCLSANPLQLGGTSQTARLLKELLPNYVQVDERSLGELAAYVYHLAEEFAYYSADNTTGPGEHWQAFFDLADGNWESFDFDVFESSLRATQEAEPHVALFLAFLYMFRQAQFDLNTMTKRHLDFYYRDVLKFQEQDAIPDQVAMIFKLAKQASQTLVKKGTELKGGKDDTGVERIYTVDRDTVINKAQVAELKALFVNLHDTASGLTPYPSNDHRIYASPIADSEDGQGAEMTSEQQDWRTFGAPEFPNLTGGGAVALVADRAFGEVGLAVSSHLLFLAEGQRRIIVECELRSAITQSLAGRFRALLSGEEAWIEGDIVSVTTPGKSIRIEILLTEDLPAVVAYSQKVLAQPLPEDYPVLKLLLDQNHASSPFAYSILKNARIKELKLDVVVQGVKDLLIENDESALDPSKPFFPFGTRPVIGSSFLLGSWEAFQKTLTSVGLEFKWKALPEGQSMGQYYHSYHDYDPQNTQYQIGIDVLHQRNWIDLDDGRPLFTDTAGNGIADGVVPASIDSSSIVVQNTAALTSNGRDVDLERIDGYTTGLQRGFLRLALQNIDFGHSKYPNSFAQQAIALSNQSSDLNALNTAQQITGVTELVAIEPSESGPAKSLFDGYLDFLTTKAEPKLPNAPYTPQWESLSLNYSASVTFQLQQSVDIQVDTCHHIEPFGTAALDPALVSNYLLPHYVREGHLYIGLDAVSAPQTLSLLIQVAEGSANPDAPRQDVHWDYLSDNHWKLLDPRYNVLSDGTNGLLTSGIVLFDLPADITGTQTRMPSGRSWIRASVDEHSDAISRLVAVVAQAVPVTFDDRENDPGHLLNPLAAESIKKLVRSDAQIDKVAQPYASFGGQMREASSAFHTRVSERLRHKHRAITIWDYEHVVLQKFPSLYKVKTVNHTRFTGTYSDYSELAPGHVSVIAIPDVQNQNAVNRLKPKTPLNTLTEIHDYLSTINAPCTELHVHNPVYEEIKVDFEVKFHSGIDAGLFSAQLHNEIQEFLSPWGFNCPVDMTFGGRVHKSMLINFIEERPYVDYLTCVKMFHIIPGIAASANTDVDEAVASTSVAILGSAETHIVHIIDASDETCTCPDNEIPSITQIRARASSCTT